MPNLVLTVTEIRDYFPEFANVTDYPDNMIQQAIDNALLIVNRYINVDDATKRFLGLYLTAHVIVYAERTKQGDYDSIGQINSKKLGLASVSYQSAMQASLLSSNFDSTAYGQQYIMHLTTWRMATTPFINING